MNNPLTIKILRTPEALAEYVGDTWRSCQAETNRTEFIVAAPLSSTPLPLYRWVIANVARFQNWQRFKFLLMDEQLEDQAPDQYVPPTDTASYQRFACQHLLEPLSQRISRPIEEMLIYPDLTKLTSSDEYLNSHGGIDLLILAYGADGHYAQVMPGTNVDVGFHVAKLSPLLATAHTSSTSTSYPDAQFRKRGMSLGPAQVLQSQRVIVMSSGSNKREATAKLLAKEHFEEEFPISIVYHPTIRNQVEICLSNESAPAIQNQIGDSQNDSKNY